MNLGSLGTRSRIGQVEPERIRVAVMGQARLQVSGNGHGYLRVDGQRRWVWGQFDESFAVQVPEHGAISIKVVGFGGVAEKSVDCSSVSRLRIPSAEQRLPRIRTSVALPAIRSLRVQRFRMPRVVRIAQQWASDSSTTTRENAGETEE